MEEAAVIEGEVMMFLAELDAEGLERACTEIELECPEAVKGKKNCLLKLMLKHLFDLATKEDQGFATYKILHTYLTPEANLEIKKENEVVTVPSSGNKTVFDLHKVKDFKISGTIGGVGEKDKLSYTSLAYQIQNAKTLGYSEDNICGAVIKAISPSNYMRTYFESKPGLQLSSVLEVLRSHFKEKDSGAVFTDLSNAVQLPAESCLDFVIRLMCLRQKVSDLSAEEGCSYDVNLLNKRFRQTMLSGLKNMNIRAEIRENCKQSDATSVLSDEMLLKMVADAVANEAERFEKFSSKKEVNAISANKDENTCKIVKQKEKSVPVQLTELKLTHEKEMSAMRAELMELKTALSANFKPRVHDRENSNDGGQRNQNRRNRRKCEKCNASNAFRCFHCFHCGSPDHRINCCPDKDKQKN